jgi:hypothetical protein
MTVHAIATMTPSEQQGLRRLIGAGSDILAITGRNLLA